VIATTKHFAGNNQETYRLGVNPGDNNVNEYLSQRALLAGQRHIPVRR
jgi:beta-glucosidase-like glycosyl hydrolase